MNEKKNVQAADLASTGYTVEEITLGLPIQEPRAVLIDERIEVSRYLARHLAKLNREMLEAVRPIDVLGDFIAGIRSLVGCSDVELWLHDPVGLLGTSFGDMNGLFGMLLLTEDSEKITAIYDNNAEARLLAPGEASRFSIMENASQRNRVYVIPAVEQGRVVGSLHLNEPKPSVLRDEGDLELLFDFMNLFPVTLRHAVTAQLTSELMLVDPITRIANREGLTRDLDRELGRARRANRDVALIAIRMCGLEGMANLSQQHIQSQLLIEVAHKIAAGLRATDAVGRIEQMCFGVLVADAPGSTVEAIARRYQTELVGEMLDDGAGGSVEILPNVSWAVVN
ncbi:MAG: GGDEF domain-containing protein, partial [Cellvibrionales bacterium]